MNNISKKTSILSLMIALSSGFYLLPINNNRVFALPPVQLISSDRGNNNYTGILGAVNNIAEEITVRIATSDNPSLGSGAIVAKQGNTYYVATVKHNFPGDISSYQIVTSDGVNHKLDLTKVEKSDAYDMAIFSFESSNNYSVATIGNYDAGSEWIFVAGFPKLRDDRPEMMITGGKLQLTEAEELLVKDIHSFSEKQNTLAYTNISHKGMSGGAVLDSQGKLIGIHTNADGEILIDNETGDYENLNLGLSLGQSVTGLIDYLEKSRSQLNTDWLNITENPAPKLNDTEVDSIFRQLATIQRPNNNSDAVDWMNYGNQLWRYYRYTDAIDAFKKAIELNPDLHQAYYAMGKTYLYPLKYREAIYALTTATNKNPGIYYYWRWLGYAYSQSQQYDLALEAYNNAIEINQGKDPILYLQRGHLHFSAKRYPKALTDYNKVTEINPEYSVGYLNQGTTYTELGEYDKALERLNRAIEIDPYSTAYIARANLYYGLQQYDRALPDFDNAIALFPELPSIYYGRGTIHQVQLKHDLALSDYNRAISLYPPIESIRETPLAQNLAFVYSSRGYVNFRLKQYEQSLADLDLAISINPQLAEAYFNRGITKDILDRYEDAFSDHNKAISINPDYLNRILNMGTTEEELTKRYQNIEQYNLSIRNDSQNANLYLGRGEAYNLVKKYGLALADYNTALSIDSQLARGYLLRGDIYTFTRQKELAEKNYLEAARLYKLQGDSQGYKVTQQSLRLLYVNYSPK